MASVRTLGWPIHQTLSPSFLGLWLRKFTAQAAGSVLRVACRKAALKPRASLEPQIPTDNRNARTTCRSSKPRLSTLQKALVGQCGCCFPTAQRSSALLHHSATLRVPAKCPPPTRLSPAPASGVQSTLLLKFLDTWDPLRQILQRRWRGVEASCLSFRGSKGPRRAAAWGWG